MRNQPQARPDIVGPWVNPHTDFKQNGPNNATGTIYGYPILALGLLLAGLLFALRIYRLRPGVMPDAPR